MVLYGRVFVPGLPAVGVKDRSKHSDTHDRCHGDDDVVCRWSSADRSCPRRMARTMGSSIESMSIAAAICHGKSL